MVQLRLTCPEKRKGLETWTNTAKALIMALDFHRLIRGQAFYLERESCYPWIVFKREKDRIFKCDLDAIIAICKARLVAII